MDECFEAWVLVADGVVSEDDIDFGIGRVWGVQFHVIEDAMDDIITCLRDAEVSVAPEGASAAVFLVRNLKHVPGGAGLRQPDMEWWEMDIFFDRWVTAPTDTEIPF